MRIDENERVLGAKDCQTIVDKSIRRRKLHRQASAPSLDKERGNVSARSSLHARARARRVDAQSKHDRVEIMKADARTAQINCCTFQSARYTAQMPRRLRIISMTVRFEPRACLPPQLELREIHRGQEGGGGPINFCRVDTRPSLIRTKNQQKPPRGESRRARVRRGRAKRKRENRERSHSGAGGRKELAEKGAGKLVTLPDGRAARLLKHPLRVLLLRASNPMPQCDSALLRGGAGHTSGATTTDSAPFFRRLG